MPFDSTGYLPSRVLTEDEADDLAVLKGLGSSVSLRNHALGGHSG